MSVFVYILKLDNKFYYTGITKNIVQRLNQHLSRSSKSTKRYLNMKLVYSKMKPNYTEARKLEVRIKNCGAGRYLNKLKFQKY